MNLKLEIEFSKAEILQEVDALKKQVDDLRPLPEDVEGKVMQKLRLDWNYHSNAIEGNRLSYGETVAFLMEGITAKGKPLKDHLDIRGHNEAINFLLSIIKDPRPISEADIRNMHQMILVEPYDVMAQTADGVPTTKRINLGEYKTSANHVRTATGETHYYATPEETPAKMQELMEWYYEVSQNVDVHPLIIAALFHYKIVAIHPFDDGNGRLSRILMNLILMKNEFPPVVIKNDDRQNYYSLLSRADNGDLWPFLEYIYDRLKSSLQLYLKAANGGDIDEEEDIDKGIALFKLELQSKAHLQEKRTLLNTKKIIENDILTLFDTVAGKANEFNEFFFSTIKFLHIDYGSGDETKSQNIILKTKYKLDDNMTSIGKVYFYCGFSEFKSIKVFDIISIWDVNFYDYKYDILDRNKKIVLSKYYHQDITIHEKQTITKIFIDELKEAITKLL